MCIRDRPYDDALHKVDAVMEQASKVPISGWVDDATFRWIGPAEKKGVCHILVNDERFKWVEVWQNRFLIPLSRWS